MVTGSREDSSWRNPLAEFEEHCPKSDTYETALTRAERRVKSWEALFQRERAESAGLVAELLSHPPERQELILRNNARYITWGVLERLLEQSWASRLESPDRAELLARLSLFIAERLDASLYGAASIEDLRARAWGYIGNARRIRTDLAGATRAFARALGHLRHGTREPIEHAALLDLQASLRRAQRRFPAALRLLRRAFSLFEEVGDRHRAGRTLLGIDIVLTSAGHPEKGIPLLYKAVEMIDPSLEPYLLLCAWHNLIDDLADAGRHLEARRLLARVRPLYARFPGSGVELRSEWLAGKIALGLRQDEEAEALLMQARRGFLAEEATYAAAAVSLELSSLYAMQGRTREMKQIAAEMVSFFSSRQIHREAAAALAHWKHAVDTETAGLDLATRLVAFFKRARYERDLVFEPPS
jgi:tetratricopeptide (TPR) repeat protein